MKYTELQKKLEPFGIRFLIVVDAEVLPETHKAIFLPLHPVNVHDHTMTVLKYDCALEVKSSRTSTHSSFIATKVWEMLKKHHIRVMTGPLPKTMHVPLRDCKVINGKLQWKKHSVISTKKTT